MQRSSERMLTTHTGSLPRPADVRELVAGRDQREVRNNPEAGPRIQAAVEASVRKQVEIGLDIPNDGEMGRVGFSSYATERLTGFDGPKRPMVMQIDRQLFPEYFADLGPAGALRQLPSCSGEITWVGDEAIARDIATFKAAL
ncbi:MAG: hypothetical protein JOZ81_04055, partial [Chloroflexi bacterium]|nr:hypothetical protein [Chloroflexota bacterium]